MKSIIRLLVVLVACLMTTTLVTAQMNIGLRGGVGLTKWHYNMPDEIPDDWNDYQEYLLTPYVALPLEIQIADFFALQPELIFMQRGTREKEEYQSYYGGGIVNYESDCRSRLNYLALPVLGKAMYRTDVLEVFVLAGPEVAYALSGKLIEEETITNGVSETIETDESIDFDEDELDRFDFGLVFGGGVGIKLGPGKAMLDARYNFGLYNVTTLEDTDLKVFNRGFGLSVGYMIPIGR